jgi:6-phosphogluconolactonase (cycloisomerase 2 family)
VCCLVLAGLFVTTAIPPGASAADRFVYVSNGFPAGNQEVAALKINPNGSLSPVTGSPFPSGGTVTEGLAMTPDAKHVYVATFGTNAVSGFNVTATGGLSVIPGSPFTTGYTTPLGVAPDPNGDHLFAWDHGAAITVTTINADGSLTNISGSPFPVPAGFQNPFAGSVAPDGNHLYVPNENTNPAGGAPDMVSAYSVAANGAVTNIQNAVAGGPAAADGNPFGSGITPNGAFLYVSAPEDNAGVGNVYGYSVGPTGLLTAVPGSPFPVTPGGSHPLNIAVAPDGAHVYVATRQTSVVKAYTINADGSLSAIGAFATGGTNGKALAFTPDGKRLYVSNNGSNNISGFDVAANGSLTLIAGSPWPTGSTGNPDLESIAITPNQPPTASFIAHSGFAGRPTAFDATGSSDADGSVKTYDWNFGDGTTLPDGGPIPNHVYQSSGNYTATLTVTDNEGCSTARIFTGKATLCNGSSVATTTRSVTVSLPPPDTTPPKFLSAAVNPPVFKLKNGTTFDYSLSEAARVVFTIDQKLKGRRVHGRCVPRTRHNRRRHHCTRLKGRGSFAQQSSAGANAVSFSGRVSNKKLSPGRYQTTLIATDDAGNHSTPTVLNFRIKP